MLLTGLRVVDTADERGELCGRILADLGVPGKKRNLTLTAWWALDFPSFRSEITKVFKRDIPNGERDDWEDWLAARQAEHEQRTTEIVWLQTELNARV